MRQSPAAHRPHSYGATVRPLSTTSRVRSALRTVVPLVVALLLGSWLLLQADDRARERTDVALRADVATAVTQVGAELRTQVSRAAAAGTAGTTFPVAAVGTSGLSLSSVIEARDSGLPTLDDAASPPSVVVAVYGSGSPPPTTAQRRVAVTAYRSVPLALRTAVTAAAPDSGGLVVRGPAHVVVAAPGAAPSGARRFAVPLDLGGPRESRPRRGCWRSACSPCSQGSPSCSPSTSGTPRSHGHANGSSSATTRWSPGWRPWCRRASTWVRSSPPLRRTWRRASTSQD